MWGGLYLLRSGSGAEGGVHLLPSPACTNGFHTKYLRNLRITAISFAAHSNQLTVDFALSSPFYREIKLQCMFRGPFDFQGEADGQPLQQKIIPITIPVTQKNQAYKSNFSFTSDLKYLTFAMSIVALLMVFFSGKCSFFTEFLQLVAYLRFIQIYLPYDTIAVQAMLDPINYNYFPSIGVKNQLRKLGYGIDAPIF